MSIIELAYVSLLGGAQVSDAKVQKVLREIKADIEDFNHRTTNFFIDVDNPSALYVIGSWESKDQHAKGYVGTDRQLSILGLAAGLMDVVWMNYVDVEYQDIPTGSPTLAITRYEVKENNQTTSDAQRARFETHWTKGPSAVGGWRIPRKDGEWKGDLWVHFVDANSGLPEHSDQVKKIDSCKTRKIELS